MVCPSGLEENLQGQEYGISAMQGAELNLPAGGLGCHHYGHTPRWPGAQHMMGCWEYTAMRPLACSKSEMKLVDLLESIENLPQKIVPRSRVTVLFNIETISWTKWEVITCQRLTIVNVPSKSHDQALIIKLCQNDICFQLVASMVCPSGLEENLQGQEYGISAMQGAELNLPADVLGRHHYGHTPRWPGAQHMMGCWEYTAMRPPACRKSEMKLVDILESIDNLPQKMVPRSRVTVLFNIETISWTKWEVITCQRLTIWLTCQASLMIKLSLSSSARTIYAFNLLPPWFALVD